MIGGKLKYSSTEKFKPLEGRVKASTFSMATNISVKLDLSKIDKAKLFKGEKGIYLDAAIIMRDEPDQYGNIGMIVQNVSKEEKANGVRGAILGNVRYIQKRDQPAPKNVIEDIDLPF